MAESERKHKYKLIYFEEIRGRAEMIKIMFSLTDTEYEFEGIKFADWMKIKPTCPLGQVPLLQTENGQIAQTTAIANFIAKRLGFLPETDWEQAVCDSIMVSLSDLGSRMLSDLIIYTVYRFRQASEDEITKNRKACGELLTKTLNYVESLAKKDAKFIFGDKITIADLALYTSGCTVEALFPDLRKHSKWMQEFFSNIESDEKVAAYLKTRPPANYPI